MARFKKTLSIAIDPEVADEARKWAEKERVQTSSYVQFAIEQRNKWHERTEEKEKEKREELTLKQAKKELLEELKNEANQRGWDEDLKKTIEIAQEMWK